MIEFLQSEEIIIPDYYSMPKRKNIERRKKYILNGGKTIIEVDINNWLFDGYISLLAQIELGQRRIKVQRVNVNLLEEKEHYIVNKIHLKQLYEEQNGYCYICGRKCNEIGDNKSNGLNSTLDHLVPRSKGGDSSLSNKKLACSLCNSLKGSFSYSDMLKDVIISELIERELL